MKIVLDAPSKLSAQAWCAERAWHILAPIMIRIVTNKAPTCLQVTRVASPLFIPTPLMFFISLRKTHLSDKLRLRKAFQNLPCSPKQVAATEQGQLQPPLRLRSYNQWGRGHQGLLIRGVGTSRAVTLLTYGRQKTGVPSSNALIEKLLLSLIFLLGPAS